MRWDLAHKAYTCVDGITVVCKFETIGRDDIPAELFWGDQIRILMGLRPRTRTPSQALLPKNGL